MLKCKSWDIILKIRESESAEHAAQRHNNNRKISIRASNNCRWSYDILSLLIIYQEASPYSRRTITWFLCFTAWWNIYTKLADSHSRRPPPHTDRVLPICCSSYCCCCWHRKKNFNTMSEERKCEFSLTNFLPDWPKNSTFHAPTFSPFFLLEHTAFALLLFSVSFQHSPVNVVDISVQFSVVPPVKKERKALIFHGCKSWEKIKVAVPESWSNCVVKLQPRMFGKNCR